MLHSNERDCYTIQLNSIYDPMNGNDLVNLYRMFAIDPNESVSSLKDCNVEISYSGSSDSTELTIQLGGRAVTGIVKHTVNHKNCSNQLTDEQIRSLIIGYKNETTEVSVTSSQIRSVTVNDSGIKIQTSDFAKVFDEEYTYSDEPETPYENLVEYTGFGSIENLEGSYIYVTPKENIHHRSDDVTVEELPDLWNVIGEIQDDNIITGEKPEINSFYQSKCYLR